MHKTKTHPDAEATAQADALPPAETMAAPAAPARELPTVVLKNAAAEYNLVNLFFELQGRLSDPRDLIRTVLADELPRFKESCPEARRHEQFKERLDETGRDLAEAEATLTAAEKSWQEAIHAAGDAAPLERNLKDAKLRLEIVQERKAILLNKKKEIEQALEAAWRKRMDELIRARRARCDETIAQVRAYLVTESSLGLALITLNDEVRLASSLVLGAQGLFALSPKIF